jgi:hypothetical protein
MLVDSSLYGKSVVGVGVTIDTTDKVLGAGSVSLRNAPVSDSYLSIPDSPHWAFGMGDFEIDFRVKFATFSQQINGLLGQYQDPSNYTALYYDSVNHKIIWEQNVGGNQNISQVWNYTFDTNWHEVTLTKASGTYILRVDGVSQSVSGTPIGSATAVTDFTGPLIIGEVFNTFLNGMNGSIDELLVLRLAKHTTDFTPATLPYGVLPSASNFFGMLPVTRVQSTPVIAHTSGFTNLGDPFVFTVNGVLNVFYTKYVDGSGDFPQIVRRPIVGDVLSVASYGSELAVLSNGGSGAWDSWGIRLNSIIDDGSGILKLYYTGCSTSQGGNAYWSIGLATSTDGGITWTKRSTPVLSPSGSLISVESASVLLHKGTYYMYHGYRTASQILPGVMVATSSDGIAWTEGDVILHTGNAYDAQYIEHHQILFYQGLFILLYESDNATGTLWTINAAYSPNPTDPFTKYVNNPIFTPSGYSGTFDITQVATPFLFQLNGVWYMFYQGGNGAHSYDSEWDIGIADF